MDEKKKILILYAEAGFGHRSAAMAVESALRETYGDRCQLEFINPLEDKRTLAILRDSQSDYDKLVRSVPELYKMGYQISDGMISSTLLESALTVLLFEVMRDLVKRHQPDAIVTTYPMYQAPLEAVFMAQRRFIPVLTVVTDLASVHRIWFNGLVDKCLVPTQNVREMAIDSGLQPDQVQITGIPVHTALTRETRSPAEIRAELGWRSDLVTILAVGSRRVERLPEMLQVLNHSGMPIQLSVVAGGDDDLYETFKNEDWHIPSYVYNYVDNIPAMMHAADVILCKAGGLIVTESLACGLPLILIDAIPGQETGNAEYVTEGGAGELSEKPVEVLKTLFHWLQNDRQMLVRRAQNARSLGKPDAAYAVAELAWEAAHREPETRTGLRIIGRSKLLELLRANHIPWV